MFDLASYYTFELERIARSSGASQAEKDAIEAERALRLTDPSRGPHDGNSEPIVALMKRRRVSA